MEKKQTAVEWLVQEMINNGLDYPISQMSKILEKAKEMEKQQIIEFLEEYDSFIFRGGDMSAEEYYNYILKQD